MSSQSSGSEQEKSHEQFIEAVKKHEVLYRPDHVNYRDKNMRQIAWEQVVAECGMTSTVDDAKNRWKYLRDSFTDSTKKQIRQNWRYRKQMEFLLPYVGLRRRKIQNKGYDVVDLTVDEPDVINQNDYSQFVEATLEDEHQNAVNGNTVINKKQSKDNELYTKTEIAIQKDDHQNNINEKPVKNSKSSKDFELYKFFMVMYKEVIQFPDRKKVDVKKRIFDVVTEEELNTTRSLLKENGFRKRSLDITSNNLPVTKPKTNDSDNSTSILRKRSSLTANTTKSSKKFHPHSKNKESYTSSNCSFLKTNSSATNFSNSNELNSLSKPGTSTMNPINVFSNHLFTEQSKNKGNELNSLSKPSTSALNVTNVFSNQALVQPKNKDIKLNATSHSPIVSTTTKTNTRASTFPNQLHNELLKRVGSQISITYPKNSTMNASIFSNKLQNEQSLPKIKSATTISIDAFSQELETEQSKGQKSELYPVPILTAPIPPTPTPNIPVSTISSSPMSNNLNTGTTFVISNVTHIGRLRDNGFQLNLESINGDTFSNKLQSTETSQNNKVELNVENCPPTEVSSSTTINSTSIVSNDKIVDNKNFEKELCPADNSSIIQEGIVSTNSVKTLDKMVIEDTDTKDEDVLSISGVSSTDVDQIVLSDENE